TVPVAARDARIMIWQMDKARVPTELIETFRPAAITDMAGRHESVQHEDCWRAPTARAQEKIRAGSVVGGELRLDRTTPRSRRAVSDCAKIDSAAAGRRGIVFVRCQFFALCN